MHVQHCSDTHTTHTKLTNNKTQHTHAHCITSHTRVQRAQVHCVQHSHICTLKHTPSECAPSHSYDSWCSLGAILRALVRLQKHILR